MKRMNQGKKMVLLLYDLDQEKAVNLRYSMQRRNKYSNLVKEREKRNKIFSLYVLES